MIRIITYFAIILLSNCIVAQENEEDSPKGFSSWSLEIYTGQNKAVRPFSEGYYSTDPNTFLAFSGVNHFEIGTRYMLSESFGLKADLAYDIIKNLKNSGSLPFSSKTYRIGLQGVANLSKILKFDSFTNRIGLLAHGGIQISKFYSDGNTTTNLSENNGGVMFGITPQYLFLKKYMAISADFSVVSNVRQHSSWDGNYSGKENNLTGLMYSTSVGLVFYLDSKRVHADWYKQLPVQFYADKEINKRLDAIETLMNDTDKDGVPDYLDAENNTPAGVAVDTRGKFIDTNKNGVPDEMERKHPARIDQNFESTTGLSNTNASALQSLIENGNVNVFFDQGKDYPNAGSANSIQLLYQFLMLYPDSKIVLFGYADRNGSELKNKQLSERRANNIKNFLVGSGIASDRISIGGQGVDKTYNQSSNTGLALARRVSIVLIK